MSFVRLQLAGMQTMAVLLKSIKERAFAISLAAQRMA
jgi:hypothetical protein